MPRTRIKFCGVTCTDDALLAARAGADAIGLVFYPKAKRRVSTDDAAKILEVLPPFVTPVGLFVDAAPGMVLKTARLLGLRHVQLHGHETPETVAQLAPLCVIKAVRVEKDRLCEELDRWRDALHRLRLSHLRGFVLETGNTKEAGGTGVENDWATVKAFQDRGAFDGLPYLITAGGLTPQNVGDVVRTIRPWAVDVSTGVEGSPGRKSAEKLEAFARAVRGTE
ncbi:MAG: phosphoribosylanthranilate isomerase [Tepidisphaeraceae bacterium]